MLIFLIFLLTIFNNNIISDNCIFSSWIHSNEEDDKTKEVYRPPSYDFPPSRGREGIAIEENGTIIFGNLDVDDRSQKIIGDFKIKEPNILNIFFKDNIIQHSMTILSCEKDRLIIQKNGR